MKVDKKVVKNLTKELRKTQKTYSKMFDYYIKKIKEADSVEELMRWHRDLLFNILQYFPIGTWENYFCLLHLQKIDYIDDDGWKDWDIDTDCKNCEYARWHNFCDAEGSTMDKIWKKLNELQELIASEFYKGETYYERQIKTDYFLKEV